MGRPLIEIVENAIYDYEEAKKKWFMSYKQWAEYLYEKLCRVQNELNTGESDDDN